MTNLSLTFFLLLQKDKPREFQDKVFHAHSEETGFRAFAIEESGPGTQTAESGLPPNEEKRPAGNAGKRLPSAASSIAETSAAIKPISINDQFTSCNETLNDPNSKQNVAEYFGLATICFN